MAAAPPVIKIGPPPPSKGKKNDFDRFIAAHPSLRPYKTAIQQWAGEYGVPALWVAATLQFESGGKNSGVNKQGTGFGLAQINPKVWFGKVFAPTGETITQAWASNPANAIQFMAYQLSHGSPASLQQAYLQNYNPGYTGTGPEGLLKGYNVTVTGTTPGQRAAGGVATAQAKQANQANQLAQAKQLLDPTYLAYAGRPATQAELKRYIATPVSLYQLQTELSNPHTNPRFYKSPIWVTGAPSQEAVYKSIYGPDAPIDAHARDLMRQAIIHNWDQTAFAQKLRDQPGYAQSSEYKGLAAQYQTSYNTIYGAPGTGTTAGQAAKTAVDQAVRKGWNTDQWAQYLRAQPAYQSSPEFKTKNIQLAQSFGLISGETGQTMLQQVNQPQTVPSG